MAINLQKITLENKGDMHMIDLSKRTDKITQEININLSWSKGTKKGLFGGMFNRDVDLDLGCFYELKDGTKNAIDGLQFSRGDGGPRDKRTRQGCYTGEPWVWHAGDDRGAAAGSGENMIINPKGMIDLKRMIIYCFIYDGAAMWQETNAVITVKVPGNAEIEVQMGKQVSAHKFCAIAEVLFTRDSVGVRKLVTFHKEHSDRDAAYGWGMQWTPASK